MTADPPALLALAVDTARAAGALLLERNGTLDVGTKTSATDPVTDKDRASERLITERLLAARPGDAVLGEEGGARGDAAAAEVRWIVDPIDGTVNYLYGLPQFAVSIAAEVDGDVVAGAVLDPVKDELFVATRGGGATRNGRPIRCSAATDLRHTLVSTGFSYVAERRARQARVLLDLLPAVRDIRRPGSSALDLCYVACGRVDAYFEKGVSLWDIAAGSLVAREAGALVTASPANDFVVAAAPGVAGEFTGLLDRLAAADV